MLVVGDIFRQWFSFHDGRIVPYGTYNKQQDQINVSNRVAWYRDKFCQLEEWRYFAIYITMPNYALSIKATIILRHLSSGLFKK